MTEGVKRYAEGVHKDGSSLNKKQETKSDAALALFQFVVVFFSWGCGCPCACTSTARLYTRGSASISSLLGRLSG